MASKFKLLVSKKKFRYQKDGFDLDLSYITDNIIAMGYPAEKLEGVYRNNIEDVIRFFQQYHKGHYKIYNLCVERQYDIEKFGGDVEIYPFEDHNVPKFEQIIQFCDDVDKYVKENKQNVAAVHCKAGKGRTGLMICCYLLLNNEFSNSEEVLKFYGNKRTSDGKGVTIPSQQRYVHYFGQYLTEKLKYRTVPLNLKSVRFECVPNTSPAWSPYFVVKCGGRTIFSPQFCNKNQSSEMELNLDESIYLEDDVKIQFYNKRVVKEKMFHCWFNTFFVLHQPQNLTDTVELQTSPKQSVRPSGLVNMRVHKPGSAVYPNKHRIARDMDSSPHDSSESGSSGSDARVINNSSSMRFPANLAHLPINSTHVKRNHSETCSANQFRIRREILNDGLTKTLTFTKMDLDKALKDTNHRLYPKDFKVTFFFEIPDKSDGQLEQGRTSYGHEEETNSDVSDASTDSDQCSDDGVHHPSKHDNKAPNNGDVIN